MSAGIKTPQANDPNAHNRSLSAKPRGQTRACIIAFLKQCQCATHQQVAAACDVKEETAFKWLSKLCESGEAHRTYTPNGRCHPNVMFNTGPAQKGGSLDTSQQREFNLAHGMQVFDWLILREAEKRNGRRYLICKCKCGREIHVSASTLSQGKTKSCKECGNLDHGMCQTSTWSSWRNMKQRCNNKAHKHYARYGGRGIGYAKEWETFEGFFSDMGERPDGKTLDRRENDEGYSKENCRWATRVEQTRNRSNSISIEFCGRAYSLSELSAHLGIHSGTLYGRLKSGRDLATPVTRSQRKIRS